jgi:hypothetical protein
LQVRRPDFPVQFEVLSQQCVVEVDDLVGWHMAMLESFDPEVIEVLSGCHEAGGELKLTLPSGNRVAACFNTLPTGTEVGGREEVCDIVTAAQLEKLSYPGAPDPEKIIERTPRNTILRKTVEPVTGVNDYAILSEEGQRVARNSIPVIVK